MSYTVFATIPVKPEHMDDACAAVSAIVRQTRSEDGCIAFEPRRSADGDSTIMIFEEWANHVAFEFHHARDYTKAVFEKYKDWLRGEPQLVVTKALES